MENRSRYCSLTLNPDMHVDSAWINDKMKISSMQSFQD